MHLHHSSRASSSAPIAPRPHRSAIKLSELVVTIALRRALANFWPRALYQGGLGDSAPVVRRVCFFCLVRCARWGFPRGADPGQVPQTLSGHAVPNRTSLLLYIILYGYVTVWYGLVRFGTVWYGLVRFGTLWYGLVRFGVVWYALVRFGTVWYALVWFGAVWYGLVRFGTVWCGLVRFGTLWCALYFSSVRPQCLVF